MALLDLWHTTPEQLTDKQIHQLIAFSGEGKLLDGSLCSKDLRAFLSIIPSKYLVKYAEYCLSNSFTDSGFALQDVVNEVGVRLGAEVQNGRYRGTTNKVGYDGFWCFPTGHSIIVEVKTSDAYRIALPTIAKYRKQLIDSKQITESESSMLLIVGRQDTGDLEAQIRGSRYAWDVRIISVDALLRLMSIKEEVDDPLIIQKIHDILVPREFTRLDEIADILFSATEDVKQDIISEKHADVTGKEDKNEDLKPVAFHEACIVRIAEKLSLTLIKRSRSQYSSPDKNTIVNCAVSKEHKSGRKVSYWFAFHSHQEERLKKVNSAYAAFGCGSSEKVMLIPFASFREWLESMHTTQRSDTFYWHVKIIKKGEKYYLQRKKNEKDVDLTKYIVA